MFLKEKIFKATHEKNGIQRYIARRFLFSFFQRFGFHITGDHFYELVPNTRVVAERYVHGPRPLKGIDWRFAECEQRMLRLAAKFGAEFQNAAPRFGFQELNLYFRGLDALSLYLLLRDLKPAKLVEIGQGYSTRIALAALEKNAQETGSRPTFVSVDPYPRFRPNDVPSCIHLQLVQKELQSLELEPLLEDCRFLFVDSSHIYKPGSDVAFQLTEVYPRLLKDTILHVHDIFSPFDYPLEWMVNDKRFWNEQYLLESFLMFNSAFEVYLPVYLLAKQSQTLVDNLKQLPLYPEFRFSGYSLYLRTNEKIQMR